MAFPRKRHPFVMENYGGSYQLRIRKADDLAALGMLDDPFWMSTSAPCAHFRCDPVLLERIDRDGNGRINSTEIREAAEWLLHMLENREDVANGSEVLRLDHIDRSHGEGQRLYQTARWLLENLGTQDLSAISLSQARARQLLFSQGARNGDGVIPAEGSPDGAMRSFIQDVMMTVGSTPDLSGSPGVDGTLLDTFIENASALLAWHSDLADRDKMHLLLPFGADTPERYGLYRRLTPKADEYFRLCEVVALNALLETPAPDTGCAPEVFQSEDNATKYLIEAPLAKPRAERRLPLRETTNPYYSNDLCELTNTVLGPLLGDSFDGVELSHEQWNSIKEAFASYEQWLEAKSGGEVERLGIEKVEGYLKSDLPDQLRRLIEEDLASAEEIATINDLEFLILLQHWLLEICNNFVSFPHLYNPRDRAMFEVGRMIMDGQVFNLNIEVTDINAHSAAAQRSGMYLLYSEVTGGNGDTPFTIVTPVTRGRLTNLGIGKRGVLFDLTGKQWDTRLVRIVENPVNLKEAVLAPFKRIGAIVASTAGKLTASAEQQFQSQITQATTTIQTGISEAATAAAAAPPPATSPPPPEDSGGPTASGRMRDMLLAGSVTIAALGSSFAYITKTFAAMNRVQLLTGLVIALAIILVPTVVVAFFRLRRQNLSAILEASGWAVNAPMRLTRRLRKLFVLTPTRPQGFGRARRDLARAYVRAKAPDKRPDG
jgi:hypothetical protein